MNKRCLSFLFCILLLQPCIFCTPTLSEKIEAEVIELQNLKQNYEEVEKRLQKSEEDLQNVETSYQVVTKDLQELSKDYEESQKRLKFWRRSLMIAIPVSFVTGYLIGRKF